MPSRCEHLSRVIPLDVLDKFASWFSEADADADIVDSSAVALATSDAQGRPSCRMVLLKSFDSTGFIFYTNLKSRKGMDLRENPAAALCFYWPSMARQVRIEGTVEPVTEDEADEYFATRPRQSQIGAWASIQSATLPSSTALATRIAAITARHSTGTIPRPPFWSSFRCVPKGSSSGEKAISGCITESASNNSQMARGSDRSCSHDRI